MMTKDDLKQARHKLGLTQADMSKLLKTPLSTYRNWEQGVSKISWPVEALIRELSRDAESIIIDCPWCQQKAVSEDHEDNGWFIGCVNNDCDIRPSFWAKDEAEALRIWNSAKLYLI